MLKEYDPPIILLRYLTYNSFVFLSGVTAVLPTLADQMGEILHRISGSLADPRTSWDKADLGLRVNAELRALAMATLTVWSLAPSVRRKVIRCAPSSTAAILTKTFNSLVLSRAARRMRIAASSVNFSVLIVSKTSLSEGIYTAGVSAAAFRPTIRPSAKHSPRFPPL